MAENVKEQHNKDAKFALPRFAPIYYNDSRDVGTVNVYRIEIFKNDICMTCQPVLRNYTNIPLFNNKRIFQPEDIKDFVFTEKPSQQKLCFA